MSPLRKLQPPKQQIGQVLIKRGIITAEQLNEALEKQKKDGGLVGELLIRLGYATEQDIIQALAIQYDFPYIPIANYEIEPDMINLVPEESARKYCLIPMDKIGNLLTVVIANPLDSAALDYVESLTKCKVEVFVGTSAEINAAIDKYYKKAN